MVSNKVKIAIAPCRRNMPTMNMPGRNGQPPRRRMMWGREAALDVKNEVLPYIFENFGNEHVEFVTLDGWDEDGIMYDYSQADSIAEYLKAMPKLSQQLVETIAKVHHIYDQLKQ